MLPTNSIRTNRTNRPKTNDPGAFVARIFARAIAPNPTRTVSEWADDKRHLEPDSPYPGKWKTSRTPFLREPMDCATLSHPSRRVTFMASAQVGKTNFILNALGQIMHETPATVLMVLPSIDESLNWARDKLEPMIAATPVLKKKVFEQKSRSSKGSTSRRKNFPGGLLELTGANSSKGLQSRTRRVVGFDEISEFPFDVDNRGDPVAMAEKRTTAWTKRGYKILAASTPGIKGRCRITSRWEESSRGWFLVPCPHCEHRQKLEFSQIRWSEGQPETAMYYCEKCGAGISESQKAGMLAAGKWEHERPELIVVHAGFRLHALYSPFVTWADVAAEQEASKNDPLLEKVFVQQTKGEAYEERHDVVPHQILWERRTPWRAKSIPPGVLFLEGATDVQGDRLEWAVYGFDRHFGQWWLDGGVIVGDPLTDAPWLEHDAIMSRTWQDAWGRHWPCQSWGIDSGFHSQKVYAYARRHAGRKLPFVMGLDGRPKWGEPPVGTPKAVDVDFHGRKFDTVSLWPVGTWDLKSEVMGALRLTEMGPDTLGVWPKGAMRFPDRLDLAFFEQLTAEACVETATKSGYEQRKWIKVRSRNEQFDLAVYARALARRDTSHYTTERWERLIAERMGPEIDLVTLMQSDMAGDLPPPPPPAPIEPPPVPPEVPPAAFVSAPRPNWFGSKRGIL